MFICGKCEYVTQPREKATKLVVATRKVEGKNGSIDKQIVKEINLCETCAKIETRGEN